MVGRPSTIDFTSKRQPSRWFSRAFRCTMGQLIQAIGKGSDPAISGHDNLNHAAIEATRRSAAEGRVVALDEIILG